MKFLSTLSLILIAITSFGQQGDKPKYLLNGEEYDSKSVFINPNNIDKVDVVKNINPPEVRITTTKKIDFLDYNAIKQKANIKLGENPAVIIDSKQIESEKALLIDKDLIKDIIINKGTIEIRTTRN